MSVVKAAGIGRIVLFFLACLALLLFVSWLALGLSGLDAVLLSGAMCGAGTWLLSWVFARWEGATLESVGARPDGGSFARFCSGFALGLMLVTLHALALRLFGHVTLEINSALQPAQILIAFFAYLFLAAREELAFHGYPLRKLAALTGNRSALFFICLVFAAEHVAGGATLKSAIAGAAVGSLLFGVASLITRGLAVPIGIHAAWNFGDWMRSSGGKVEGGIWIPVVQPGFEDNAVVVGWIAYVVLMLGAVVLFVWWGARGQDKAAQPIRP